MELRKTLFFSLIFLFMEFSAFAQGFGSHKEFASGTDPIKKVEIYPNPSTDFVHIKFETELAKKTKLTVYNILGNAMEAEQEVIDGYEIKIKVKDLPAGYYLVSIKDKAGVVGSTYKFLKR